MNDDLRKLLAELSDDDDETLRHLKDLSFKEIVSLYEYQVTLPGSMLDYYHKLYKKSHMLTKRQSGGSIYGNKLED